MATYKLTLLAVNEPNCTIRIEELDAQSVVIEGTQEDAVVGGLPLKGTSPAFVTAATTYVSNMLTARAAAQAAKDALAASPAVKALVGQSTNITV